MLHMAANIPPHRLASSSTLFCTLKVYMMLPMVLCMRSNTALAFGLVCLRYTLFVMRILIYNPALVYGDNQSILWNTKVPDLTRKKK